MTTTTTTSANVGPEPSSIAEDQLPRPVCASAPGKVILFGEHAVVYGEPAVAAALSDLRVVVTLIPTRSRQIQLVLPNLHIHHALPCSALEEEALEDLQEPPTSDCAARMQQVLLRECYCSSTRDTPLEQQQLAALTPLLYLLKQLAPQSILKSGLRILVQSQELPVGAGLGSSAAFGVASAAALIRLVRDDKEDNINEQPVVPDPDSLDRIHQYAYYSEILLHGTPSGIDNAVSTFGGAMLFTKDMDTSSVSMQPISMPRLEILLVHTHVPRSTRELVAGVRTANHTYPAVTSMLQAMGALATQFCDWCKVQQEQNEDDQDKKDSDKDNKDDHTTLLSLLRMNQDLLRAVGVSHPSLDCICRVVDEVAGPQNGSPAVAAAKLTGAGGGGCAIVVLRPNLDEHEASVLRIRICKALKQSSHPYKFTCFSSSVGGDGVLWWSPQDWSEEATSTSRNGWRPSAALLALAATSVVLAMGLRRSKRR